MDSLRPLATRNYGIVIVDITSWNWMSVSSHHVHVNRALPE